jgi:hypothetical protein
VRGRTFSPSTKLLVNQTNNQRPKGTLPARHKMPLWQA